MSDKECSRCGTWKPMADFHRNCQSPDGRHTVCRHCRHEQREAYNAQRSNPAQVVMAINARREWRTDEERLLARFYKSKGGPWCAMRIGRTCDAVKSHYHVMRRRAAR